MSQFNFAGVGYIAVPDGKCLSPHRDNYILDEWGDGNPHDPANCYNVYEAAIPGAYIFQSQLNGKYLGMDDTLRLVGALFDDPSRSQPLIPTPYEQYNYHVTIYYLPDKTHFLGYRSDGEGWDWETDIGGYSVPNDGGLWPTTWSVNDLLAGKGTGGFTLNYANLTGRVFPAGTDLTGVNLSGAVLDETTLDQCNLTRVVFTNCQLKQASLKGAILVETVFNNAKLGGAKFLTDTLTNVKGLGATLDGTDFTGATLNNAALAGASLNQTILKNATLQGGDFSNCDLRTVISDGIKTVSAQAQPVVLNGATLHFPLIGLGWQWMDLRHASIDQLPQPLSSAGSPLQATGAKLSGLNQSSLVGASLTHAILDNSLLDGLDLSGADLSGASLINASLHGTTLTNVKLPDAQLAGAQLGALSHLFALPLSVESALNAGQVSAIAPDFAKQGITLSSTATLHTLAANRVWELNDAGNGITYNIRVETQAGGTQVLSVYGPAVAASLVDAYMPNAVLTGANLYGVLASGAQFYGSKARIDGSAILERVEYNGANLSNLNLTQANLFGANLSGAQLFNARFNKANLGPSADGVATNLSQANLQGADFTDALLYGANLANAAVAVEVPTKGNPKQGGVWLFSLPYAGDTNTLAQYTAELNAAATRFSLNPQGDAATLQKYVTALKTNDLTPLKLAFLKQQPPIPLSANAQIETVEAGTAWQIVDGTSTYTLWEGLDQNGNTELYAAPSLTSTRAAFQQNDLTLRWQASAAVDTAGQQWLVDNDSENPQNFSTGYVKFILKLNGGALDVYGTAVRIERLGDDHKQQMDTETCNVTVLAAGNMNGETVCPNGAKLSTNQTRSGKSWDVNWLRASAPPAPPTCVPTDYSWCPPTQTQAARSSPRVKGSRR